MKRKPLVLLGLILGLAAAAAAQGDVRRPGVQAAQPSVASVPADLSALLTPKQSEMRVVAQRYEADRNQLSRFYHAISSTRFARLKRFDQDWTAALDGLKTDSLSAAARADLRALQTTVQTNVKRIEAEAAAAARMAPLVPCGGDIALLEEARMRMDPMDAEKAAVILSRVSESIVEIRTALDAALADPVKLNSIVPGKDLAVRAADSIKGLRNTLQNWFNFYNDYDPLFTWWMAQPDKQANKALEDYETYLRDKVAPVVQAASAPAAQPLEVVPAAAPQFAEVPDLQALLALAQDEMRGVVQKFRSSSGRGARGGPGGGGALTKASLMDWLAALKRLHFDKLSRAGQIDYLYLRNAIEVQLRRAGLPAQANIPRKTDDSGIPGQPVGREALILGLAEELIPYTPEELIVLADRQYAWCEAEMKKAARAMGFGDDWKGALEKVKAAYAEPGRQPEVIRDLLRQSVDYLRAHDLITIPEIEEETLRMEMMPAEMQLVNPFFTGGPVISVSYPTSTMTTRQKLESMRGNNMHFAHATVFHEMIPGHNMQGFMSQRFGGTQAGLGTSFWLEGWPLYWETLLYDLGFDETPEDRIGALFWRMHRCARIVFSLRFHLGEWSPQECIDYLIARVGHERENATGEVRRSFAGGYGPLYQAAYMLGGLQMREVRKEFVDSGKMTLKQFHDSVIQGGSMPIALLRLALGTQKLNRNMSLEWKCYGPLSGPSR